MSFFTILNLSLSVWLIYLCYQTYRAKVLFEAATEAVATKEEWWAAVIRGEKRDQ